MLRTNLKSQLKAFSSRWTSRHNSPRRDISRRKVLWIELIELVEFLSHSTIIISYFGDAKEVPGSARTNQQRLDAAMNTEMALFQFSGVRGRGLQLVYKYLLSIPAASTEAARAFSAAEALREPTKIHASPTDL